MKKRFLALMALLLVLAMVFAGCAPAPQSTGESVAQESASAKAASAPSDQNNGDSGSAITVTDMLGRNVSIPADADSFVAIGPGCLRLYCYVGDTAQLAGIEQLEVDDAIGRPYMMLHPELNSLPIVGPGGPGNAPDAEKLLVADPDVIFTMYNAEAGDVDDLQEKAGIPVVALGYGETELFDPVVDQSLELIGTVTGREDRAQEIVSYFAEMKSDLEGRTADIPDDHKPSAYMGGMGNRGAHGIESTTGNFSLFNVIGAKNCVEQSGIGEYVMLDKEKILEMNPDVIFIDGGGLALTMEDYEKNPDFYKSLGAFQNGQVYMHLPYNYYYTNLEVALADAYYMGFILYPEQFSDIDPAAKFDEISTELLGGPIYTEMADAYFGGYQRLIFE